MAKIWTKIINVLDTQVLFFLEPGANDTITLHQMIHYNGVCCDSQIRHIPLPDAETIFEGIDERSAEMVVKTIEDLMLEHEDKKINNKIPEKINKKST